MRYINTTLEVNLSFLLYICTIKLNYMLMGTLDIIAVVALIIIGVFIYYNKKKG